MKNWNWKRIRKWAIIIVSGAVLMATGDKIGVVKLVATGFSTPDSVIVTPFTPGK